MIRLVRGDKQSKVSDASFNMKAADILDECAEILRRQKANPFRVNAYVRAAETLRSLPTDARDVLRDGGVEALIGIPTIGRGLAASIDEIARTGRLARLDRLRGETTPEDLFQTVPGIGPKLARIIHDELHVDTLEALEVAVHDGRFAAVPGIGPRRTAAVRASIADILMRSGARRQISKENPSVAMLLDVDREYRQRSTSDKLPKIAPKRFNPEGIAWLPILHTDRDKWHFTALFSNTALAHDLGRTDDWVVVYYYDSDHREGQNTIVTETRGTMKGTRVVRGREAECRAHYSQARS